MPAIMGQSAHTRGHGILGERQRSESTCDPTGSIARATRTRGELERARNVRRAALRDRDEGSMEPTLMRPPREKAVSFHESCGPAPAAAMARDTRSPSRRLPRAEKRTRRQQGDTLYHGRLDGRNLAETHGVELSTTASGGTRTPAAQGTRPAAYPRRARASTCPKTCAPRMVNCKSCARLGANLARRSAHARALTIQRPSSSRP